MKSFKFILPLSIFSLICTSAFAAEERSINEIVDNPYHMTCYTPSGFKIFESDIKGYTISNASFVTATMPNGKPVRLANAICKIEDK